MRKKNDLEDIELVNTCYFCRVELGPTHESTQGLVVVTPNVDRCRVAILLCNNCMAQVSDQAFAWNWSRHNMRIA